MTREAGGSDHEVFAPDAYPRRSPVVFVAGSNLPCAPDGHPGNEPHLMRFYIGERLAWGWGSDSGFL